MSTSDVACVDMLQSVGCGIIGITETTRGCHNYGSVTIVGVNDLRQDKPKPSCRNRTRTTAKCRRKCCRRERPKPLVDDGHQSKLWISSEVGVQNQLRNWRNVSDRLRWTPRKTAGQSSQPDDDRSGTQAKPDAPKGSGGAKRPGG